MRLRNKTKVIIYPEIPCRLPQNNGILLVLCMKSRDAVNRCRCRLLPMSNSLKHYEFLFEPN